MVPTPHSRRNDIFTNQRFDGVFILDITPTLLNLYGLPIPADMDGHLVTAFSHEPRQEPRLRTGEATDRSGTGNEQNSDEEASEVESRLRGLGYIE
jgi:arylsulfatase A-like enzyme